MKTSTNNVLVAAATALVLFIGHGRAMAAETCGNGIDDDADGYADEGCGFSNWVAGICESPMSCAETGDVDPVTGAWVYQLPADIAPTVPFGPTFEFRRTFMSMYSPPSTDYRTAMGNRWQHNFQSWLDVSGTSPNRVVIVHLPTGQDVRFAESGTPGDGYTYFNNFQAGAYFKHLRQAAASPNDWELKTLTGEVYKFDWSSPTGKLIEIHDSLATPNKILITYFTNGGNKGQIDTVSDASGRKRFKFFYSHGRVSSVQYQTGSGTWTTRVTLSLSYTSSNPTSVQIAGTTIQTYTYTSGYLTKIADGGGTSIVEVNYRSATPGKLANLTVANGALGYEYASHSQCSSGTAMLFNTTGSACSIDSQCGGYFCGGKTGAGGDDGKCYRAARCLTTTSPSENVITSVAAFTPCTGACAPTAQYSWNVTTLDLKGVKLADNNWTSYVRNANGMVTLMARGDTDDDPTNAGGVKTWFFYSNSSFPGRLTEWRIRSDVRVEGTFQCDATHTDGCKRIQYAWNGDGLLSSKEEDGFLRSATGTIASYAYISEMTYDTNGRPTQINGPLFGTDDVVDVTYWSSSDVLKDGYTNLVKRKKNSTEYLITTRDGYDYFGNATSTQDPDGTFTCRTWDGNRNYLSQVRETMADQPSCSSSDTSDLVTSYLHDTALRLTKTTNPLGDCEHREYDGFGRLQYTKLRDDCTATNPGNTRTEYYSANGQKDKTEWLDSTGTVKRRHETSFTDGLQIAGWKNPVAPSYSRTFSYFADGTKDALTFENGIGKTGWIWDPQNRDTSRKRYTDSEAHQDWTFGYPASNATMTRRFETATDPASKLVTTNYDDMNRRNRVVSPDSNTTLLFHDAAGRLVTLSEGSGTYVHQFTYDNLGRRLTEDYDNNTENCNFATQPETVMAYDTPPVACPSGALCTNQSDRLAYVKTKLLCSTAYADSTLDQETFFAYDDAGRLVQEYIRDDSGRTADQRYTWDKNGNMKEVTTPSGASMTYTLGGSGNSDANLITALARTVSGTPTTLLSTISWAPFGPVMQYDQENTISGNKLQATLTWNLAYRATQIRYSTTGVSKTSISYTEDEKGRYTQKIYSNVHPGIQSSYLQYDWFDRPTCDATVSGTCPSEGSTMRTNVRLVNGGSGYNNSNDRAGFFHQDPLYGDTQYSVTFGSGRDQITSFAASGESLSTVVQWTDARGVRTGENNQNSTVDDRTYTYENRARVRTVTGKYLRAGITNTFRDYRVTYAWDHRDRLAFRSFKDLVTNAESSAFYYYDYQDRLIEVKVTPNIGNPSSFTIYNFYWLGQRPVAMWATAYPAATTARYFMHADEANRVLEVYSWPTSGDASVVWALNPDAFGWDRQALSGPYQPLRLNNMIFDDGTVAWLNDPIRDRPGLLIQGGVHYDPMLGTYLQPIGEWPNETYSHGLHLLANGLDVRTYAPTQMKEIRKLTDEVSAVAEWPKTLAPDFPALIGSKQCDTNSERPELGGKGTVLARYERVGVGDLGTGDAIPNSEGCKWCPPGAERCKYGYLVGCFDCQYWTGPGSIDKCVCEDPKGQGCWAGDRWPPVSVSGIKFR